MNNAEIVSALAKCDPVYGPVRGPNKTSIRICALCRRESADNAENVTHAAGCPWLPAVQAVKAGLAPK